MNSLRGDFSLAKKELGWKPKTQIKTLIKEMVYTELKILKMINKKSRIFVTGHKGLVGSAIIRRLNFLVLIK